MSRWWRAYDEALDDPKLQMVGLEMLGAWFNLMCLASKNDGAIRIPDVPFALRMSKARAAEVITRLATAGLLDRDGDIYRPHNWGGRQFLSDSNGNQRVKRYRDRRVAAGLDRQWAPSREFRRMVYERDGFKCVYCGSGDDLTLDHLTPELRGGTHDIANLQTCCRVCNASKRDMTHDEFVTRNGGVTLLETASKRHQNRTEQKTEKKEDIYSAGAKLRPEAFSISDECYRILGINLEMIPLEWCGLTYQIDIMLNRGYDPPGILATAAKLSGHKPLKPLNYFVKAVESSRQNQIKPAGQSNGKSGSVVQAADRLIEKLAYFDEPAPESAGICGGTGETPVRTIPPRRRE